MAGATARRARAGRPVNHELRSAVLVATAELLSAGGYDDVTMEQIAARSGAAKQTLYRVWGSKVEVVADTVLQGAFALQAEEVPDSGQLRRDLSEWLGGIARYLDRPEIRSVVCALAASSAASHGSDRADVFDRVLTVPVGRLLAARFESARRRGELAGHVSITTVVDLILGYLTLVSIGRARLDEVRIGDLVALLTPANGI